MSDSSRHGSGTEDCTDDAPLSSANAVSSPETSGVIRRLDFGARYHVLRVLARGGMGEVILAYDTELSRLVALKVMRLDRPDQDWALARFRREVALASRVTHENVLRVFDLGDAGLTPFLSMQYVDGEDLGTILRRERALPVERALHLFRQICAGVTAAHDQGIVHRDLKPRNVLVDRDDHVFVGDFGVARRLDDPTITATGALIGSPAYVSPEQVKGEPTNERSDVYALGVILYEMLTGMLPFEGDSAHAVMEQRLHRKPRRVRALRPEVPRYLEKVVSRCLALQTSRRHPSVRALVRALDPAARDRDRWGWRGKLGVLVAGSLAATVAGWTAGDHGARHVDDARVVVPRRSAAPVGVTPVLSKVLILGIKNETADPVFDRTLDTVLSFALRRSPSLEPWNGGELQRLALEVDPSKPTLDDALMDKLRARDGGRVIGVKGSVAPSGARLSIELSVTEAGAVLLSRTVEADESRVVPALGRLAREIRAVLGEELPEVADDAEETGTSPSIGAVYEYTTATDLANSGKIVDSLLHYQRAVSLDPGFALAHGDFAVELSDAGRWGRVFDEDERALASADRLDPRSRLLLVGSAAAHRGDYRAAENAFDDLLGSWPRFQPAETNLGCVYISEGDYDRAAPLFLKTARLHPRDVVVQSNVTSVEVGLGDFEAVIRSGEGILRDFTNAPPSTYRELALAYAQLGRSEDARAILEKLATVDGPEAATALADFEVARGRLRDASAGLERALATGVDQEDLDGAAAKRALLAEVRLRRDDRAGAAIAAKQAAAFAEYPSTRLAAGLAELGAGDIQGALSVAARLAKLPAPNATSYSRLLQAEALRVEGKPLEAIPLLESFRGDDSCWLVRYLIGRSYLDAGRFSEAAAALETFVEHAGRALEGYGDGTSTSRFLPPARYYLGRAREAAGDARTSDAYATFLATQQDADPYPMLEDARRRLDALHKR